MMLSVAGRLSAPFLAAAALCAAGCGSLDLPAPERVERPERHPPVSITVEEVPADGGWHVY
ncbi:MAG TPA: hypothetical protein VLF66_04235, partial [Thermoanaerobaculia bacterium]|nr:hypothetical protein [Thermoanaerobaculia bacterium]